MKFISRPKVGKKRKHTNKSRRQGTGWVTNVCKQTEVEVGEALAEVVAPRRRLAELRVASQSLCRVRPRPARPGVTRPCAARPRSRRRRRTLLERALLVRTRQRLLLYHENSIYEDRQILTLQKLKYIQYCTELIV